MTMKTGFALSAAILAAVTFATERQSERVVIGKLGQAVKEVKITSKPGSGRRYYTVKPYEYLVLRTGPTGFFRVLLQNGQLGYVASTSIARLPYDVTQSVKPKRGVPTQALAFNGPAQGSASARSQAAYAGLNYRGTPYKWGGNDPMNGIDCSAFVKYLYGRIGLNLPRTAAEQALVGQKITRLEDLKPGDRLYFWSSKRNMIGHTGLYLGNGYFVHSSVNNKGVATDYLTQKWLNILVSARR